MSFDAPAQGNPREYPHEPYIFSNYIESLAYNFLADSMGLSSFEFMQWAPKDAYTATDCWPKTDFDVK